MPADQPQNPNTWIPGNFHATYNPTHVGLATAVPVLTTSDEENDSPRPRKARKSYSENSDDSVQNIFHINDIHQISTTEAEKFLVHHQQFVPQKPYQFAAPKVLIGLEAEIENVLKIDPNLQLLFWTMKQDGSLRNNGQEFITPGAIPIGLAESAITQLFASLNPNIDFSQRCSWHVHMDVRSLSLKQILTFILAYSTVENLLFKYVGNSRRTNIFCVPIIETGLFEKLQDNPKAFMHSIDSHWSKYTAVNLLPIVSQGSIEFRHMPGTNNVQKLLVWIDLISKLKLYAYKTSLEAVTMQILELNSNSRYKEYVESIFGDGCQYLDMSNLLTDMEKAVYLMKNSVVVNAFHKFVTSASSINPNSILHKRMGQWMDKLTPAQQDALRELWAKHTPGGGGDLESFFRELIRDIYHYRRAWPKDIPLLEAIVGHKLAPKVKKEIKFDIEAMTLNTYNQLLNQENNDPQA